LFVEAHPRLPKNNPQALPPLPGGPLRARALGRGGPPEIPMASEYNTGVSGGFRQAGNNVALWRAVLPIGTLPLIQPAACSAGSYATTILMAGGRQLGWPG
jgi:hypothetical protein